jgi:hypothetical protein
VVPGTKFALQVVEQAVIPGGLLSMVPCPLPLFVTVSVNRTDPAVNVAVTVGLPTMATVTVHDAPGPLQPAPLNPLNVDPFVGVAVRLTVEPVAKAAAHMPGQEIPLGLLVTLPVPLPAKFTVSRSVETATLKRAVTVALLVTEQGPVLEQPPPLQPAKAEPGSAAAFKEMVLPS